MTSKHSDPAASSPITTRYTSRQELPPMVDRQTTPFEVNIAEQPEALRRLAEVKPPEMSDLVGRSWGRIVLTGMGSSHFVGTPTWRRLVGLGHNAWTIDTGDLLDNINLITGETLLIVTSQSGASGEITELLARRQAGQVAAGFLVGIANDPDSPLARSADLYLPSHSGAEATVSTKSYLNSMAVHRLLQATFAYEDVGMVCKLELRDAADAVQAMIDSVDLVDIARATAHHPSRRLAYIGSRDTAATALFAALITKEASKVPAEGYIAGQFRHGPLELAGDGLTVVIFAPDRHQPDLGLRRLATDLLATGSKVMMVGDDKVEAHINVPVGGTTALAALAAGSVVAELFAVELAVANGVVPGAFVYGSKITTTI